MSLGGKKLGGNFSSWYLKGGYNEAIFMGVKTKTLANGSQLDVAEFKVKKISDDTFSERYEEILLVSAKGSIMTTNVLELTIALFQAKLDKPMSRENAKKKFTKEYLEGDGILERLDRLFQELGSQSISLAVLMDDIPGPDGKSYTHITRDFNRIKIETVDFVGRMYTEDQDKEDNIPEGYDNVEEYNL